MTVPAIRATRGGTTGAPTLVLGPSLGTASPLWDAAAELLGAHFSLLTWDLPGHGRSGPANAPFTVAELADAVISVADASGVDAFAYAGVSLGGAVGLDLGLRHPERVTGIAMICSLARFGTAEAWNERAALVRAQSTSVLIGPSAGRWFSPGSIARLPEVTGRLLNALADTDDESYALCCEALADFDAREQLTELSVPLLAISGRDDPVATSAAVAEIAATAPQGRAADIPDAGHLAPAEQPAAVAGLLMEFLGSEK